MSYRNIVVFMNLTKSKPDNLPNRIIIKKRNFEVTELKIIMYFYTENKKGRRKVIEIMLKNNVQ